MPLLCVNIDHVATLRQARLGHEPEPVAAAAAAELGGAIGIIMHLREDRRHVQDRDVELVRQTIHGKFNLEMAATAEIQAIALRIRPHTVCLVPEKRQELTTEGGLNCLGREAELKEYLKPIHDAGIESSLFVDADPRQIEAAHAIGSKYVELHTGHYADATTPAQREAEFRKITTGIALARELGLTVNLGHGLDYINVLPFADVPGVNEYSIGHSIIARAVFTGLTAAVREMAELVRGFRA